MSSWFRSYGFAEILDRLLIGAYPLDADDVAMLDWMGVERVLNVVDDDEYRPGDREAVEAALAAAGIEECRLPLIDYGNLPPEAIEWAVQEIMSWLADDKRVYLHCRAGWQRSAALAAAVIAASDGTDVDQALEVVRSQKPSADPLPHQREDLQRWWDERRRRRQGGAAGGGPGGAAGGDPGGAAGEGPGSGGVTAAQEPSTPPPATDGP